MSKKIVNFGLVGFAVSSPLSLFAAEMCIAIVVIGWIFRIISEKTFNGRKVRLIFLLFSIFHRK